MDSCKYCGGAGGAHAPGCPAGQAAAANAAERRKFASLPDWLQRGRPDCCRFCRGIGEHTEDCSVGGEKPDFRNVDLLNAALAYGDPPWQDDARAFCKEYGMTDEEVDAAIANQRLRRDTHAAMKAEIERRRQEGPEPSAEELSMGAFLESIEPQAREAVRLMRKKGYATASSGFGDLDRQSVVLTSPDLLDLTEDEKTSLDDLGVKRSDRGTGFNFRIGVANIEEIAKLWNKIAERLPDLGHPAPEASFPAATQFRQVYGRAKRDKE